MEENDRYNTQVLGAKIVNIRWMTPDEMERECWENCEPSIVIELDNGVTIFPSIDMEGNAPGVMFGTIPKSGNPLNERPEDDSFYLLPNFTQKGDPIT